jgi:hypothetical protein
MKFTTATIFAALATTTVAHKHPQEKSRRTAADFPNLETITHFPEGRLDSTRGKRSLAEEKNVVDMNGLFNTVSNYYGGFADNTGNSIMANGDIAILAVGSYKGAEGSPLTAASYIMLITNNLNGEVKCVEDNASCVLDGGNAMRVMHVHGTGSKTLILRALTFDKGSDDSAGGVYIDSQAKVDLELCIFSNNRATSDDHGGGAVYVRDGSSTVNIYGTSFNGNTAATGYGNDIRSDGGTITIQNYCPSPYTSNIPIQGKTRMRIV